MGLLSHNTSGFTRKYVHLLLMASSVLCELANAELPNLATFSESIVQVSIETNDHRPHSNGTAFVVAKNGILATAFHVVVPVINAPERFIILVGVSEKQLQARLLAIDSTNDIALIKVAHVFSKELPLRKRALISGEGLSSFGFGSSEWSFNKFTQVDQTYVEPLTDSVRYGLRIAPETLRGMSGGPVLDSRHEVVGVVSATLFDPTKPGLLAIPASSLAGLMAKSTSDSNELSPTNAKVLLHNQLLDVESKLRQDWQRFQTRDSLQPDWQIERHGSTVYCHAATQAELRSPDSAGRFVATLEKCWLHFSSFSSQGRPSGYYWTTYASYSSLSMGDSELAKLAQDVFDNYLWPLPEPDGSVYGCKRRRAISSTSLPMLIEECVRPNLEFEPLVDTQIKAVTQMPNGRKQLVAAFGLYGFRPESAREMTESWLSGIRANANASLRKPNMVENAANHPPNLIRDANRSNAKIKSGNDE